MHLLLADENFSAEVSVYLQEFGHDVLSLADLGLSNIQYPDDRVLETADLLGRCVITFNRKDFIKLHKQGAVHHGIVICTFNRDAVRLAEKIDEALSKEGSLKNKLLRVYKD